MPTLPEKLVQSMIEAVAARLDELKVREQVDAKGIDRVVEEAARAAALGGAAAGLGGAPGLVVGLPADTVNLLAQHLRVCCAVMYDRTGRLPGDPTELVRVAGLAVGVRLAGSLGGQVVAGRVSRALAERLSGRLLARAVPVAGAAVGAGLNYTHIRSVARTLQQVDIGELVATPAGSGPLPA